LGLFLTAVDDGSRGNSQKDKANVGRRAPREDQIVVVTLVVREEGKLPPFKPPAQG